MKSVSAFVLSVLLTVGGIAHVVSASTSPDETVEQIPDKASLKMYVPKQISVVGQAWLERRLKLVDETKGQDCAEWAGLAYDIGWPVEQIPKLLRIIYRESRCLPFACSQSDSGRVCRDWGLTQINEYSWRTTIVNQGMVMKDMWTPELNLRFALWLYTYSLDRNRDGWLPWAIQH